MEVYSWTISCANLKPPFPIGKSSTEVLFSIASLPAMGQRLQLYGAVPCSFLTKLAGDIKCYHDAILLHLIPFLQSKAWKKFSNNKKPGLLSEYQGYGCPWVFMHPK